MNFTRLWALFKARNKEFFRDRAAFGWNFLFPFLLVAGVGIIFGGKEYTEFITELVPINVPNLLSTRIIAVITSLSTPNIFSVLSRAAL